MALWFVGGDKLDRTTALLNAIQALSQLSLYPHDPETLVIPHYLVSPL